MTAVPSQQQAVYIKPVVPQSLPLEVMPAKTNSASEAAAPKPSAILDPSTSIFAGSSSTPLLAGGGSAVTNGVSTPVFGGDSQSTLPVTMNPGGQLNQVAPQPSIAKTATAAPTATSAPATTTAAPSVTSIKNQLATAAKAISPTPTVSATTAPAAATTLAAAPTAPMAPAITPESTLSNAIATYKTAALQDWGTTYMQADRQALANALVAYRNAVGINQTDATNQALANANTIYHASLPELRAMYAPGTANNPYDLTGFQGAGIYNGGSQYGTIDLTSQAAYNQFMQDVTQAQALPTQAQVAANAAAIEAAAVAANNPQPTVVQQATPAMAVPTPTPASTPTQAAPYPGKGYYQFNGKTVYVDNPQYFSDMIQQGETATFYGTTNPDLISTNIYGQQTYGGVPVTPLGSTTQGAGVSFSNAVSSAAPVAINGIIVSSPAPVSTTTDYLGITNPNAPQGAGVAFGNAVSAAPVVVDGTTVSAPSPSITPTSWSSNPVTAEVQQITAQQIAQNQGVSIPLNVVATSTPQEVNDIINSGVQTLAQAAAQPTPTVAPVKTIPSGVPTIAEVQAAQPDQVKLFNPAEGPPSGITASYSPETTPSAYTSQPQTLGQEAAIAANTVASGLAQLGQAEQAVAQAAPSALTTAAQDVSTIISNAISHPVQTADYLASVPVKVVEGVANALGDQAKVVSDAIGKVGEEIAAKNALLPQATGADLALYKQSLDTAVLAGQLTQPQADTLLSSYMLSLPAAQLGNAASTIVENIPVVGNVVNAIATNPSLGGTVLNPNATLAQRATAATGSALAALGAGALTGTAVGEAAPVVANYLVSPAVISSIAQAVGTGAALNTLGTAITSIVQGRLPTWEQLGGAAVTGAEAGALAGAVSPAIETLTSAFTPALTELVSNAPKLIQAGVTNIPNIANTAIDFGNLMASLQITNTAGQGRMPTTAEVEGAWQQGAVFGTIFGALAPAVQAVPEGAAQGLANLLSGAAGTITGSNLLSLASTGQLSSLSQDLVDGVIGVAYAEGMEAFGKYAPKIESYGSEQGVEGKSLTIAGKPIIGYSDVAGELKPTLGTPSFPELLENPRFDAEGNPISIVPTAKTFTEKTLPSGESTNLLTTDLGRQIFAKSVEQASQGLGVEADYALNGMKVAQGLTDQGLPAPDKFRVELKSFTDEQNTALTQDIKTGVQDGSIEKVYGSSSFHSLAPEEARLGADVDITAKDMENAQTLADKISADLNKLEGSDRFTVQTGEKSVLVVDTTQGMMHIADIHPPSEEDVAGYGAGKKAITPLGLKTSEPVDVEGVKVEAASQTLKNKFGSALSAKVVGEEQALKTPEDWQNYLNDYLDGKTKTVFSPQEWRTKDVIDAYNYAKILNSYNGNPISQMTIDGNLEAYKTAAETKFGLTDEDFASSKTDITSLLSGKADPAPDLSSSMGILAQASAPSPSPYISQPSPSPTSPYVSHPSPSPTSPYVSRPSPSPTSPYVSRPSPSPTSPYVSRPSPSSPSPISPSPSSPSTSSPPPTKKRIGEGMLIQNIKPSAQSKLAAMRTEFYRRYAPSLTALIFPKATAGAGIKDINNPLLATGLRPLPQYLSQASKRELAQNAGAIPVGAFTESAMQEANA